MTVTLFQCKLSYLLQHMNVKCMYFAAYALQILKLLGPLHQLAHLSIYIWLHYCKHFCEYFPLEINFI